MPSETIRSLIARLLSIKRIFNDDLEAEQQYKKTVGRKTRQRRWQRVLCL